MSKLTYVLVAISAFAASPVFAADCDRNEFAVRWFEQDMDAQCEYVQEERGQKWWNCRTNQNFVYFRFFSEDQPQWPYALTQTNVCTFDNFCQIWDQGHCTCDECVIEWQSE